jgi:prepilin-type N-terminal cleavage/methylation domain-containing protein
VKKGFTLIELIIALAIFSMSILAVTMGFSVSIKIRQMNDVKQATAGYAQAIIENFRVTGYNNIDAVYTGDLTTGVSTYVYFNEDMSNFNSWFQNYINGIETFSGNVDTTAYPLSNGNKFGALIKVDKTNFTGNPYHIYVRVWMLNKGSQSQSVRDIYESR